MTMQLDNRQSRQRSALDQLSNSSDLRLDTILNLINDELTMPLRLSADATPSRNLNIGAIEIQTIDGSTGTGRKRTIQPITNLLPSFTPGYMTFPASSGGTITSNNGSGWFQSTYTLTLASDQYMKVMIALDGQGKVVLVFGTTGASEAAATMPVALSGTLPIGYVVLQNVAGTIQSVTDSNIRQFAGGGGGSGSGALSKQVTQASHGFSVGQVLYLNGSTYALAKADAANTAETIGIVSSVISTNMFEVAELGYISGITAPTLIPGEQYFLSPDTAGLLTVTEPTTIGHVSKPMLIADTTSSGYVLNYRGVVVGGTNARTQLSLANNSINNVFNVTSYDAGELTGWIYIAGTTNYRFQIAVQFAKNGAGSDYNIAYQTVGDTPPAGFTVSYSSPNIRVTLPNIAGFASSIYNYALNAPAVGATFPLAIDAGNVTTGVIGAARLPVVVPGTSAGVVAAAGLPGNTTGSAIAAGYVGEIISWVTPPGSQLATTTETDWTNSAITLTPGVWLVTANINALYQTGVTAGANGATVVKITDSSNNTVQNMIKVIFSGYGNGTQAAGTESNLGFSFVANIASSTLYKIRLFKQDASGVGVGSVYNAGNERSHFYAIRIA